MDFKTLLVTISGSILKPITVLIIALAVIFFLLGVLKYIQSVGDETKRKEGTTMMVYGIVGIFVMVSLWGLVHVLQSTFTGLDNNPINPPSLGGSSNSSAASTPLNSRTSPDPLNVNRGFDSFPW